MKTIVLCCPGNNFSGKFIHSISKLIFHLSNKGFKILFSTIYLKNIYEVRNKCLLGNPKNGSNQPVLDGVNYDYILWIDSDITFTAEDFDKLYKEDAEVISGLYLMSDGHRYAAVEDWDEEYFLSNGTFQFLQRPDVERRVIPFNVAYVGLGFALFKKGVFEKLKYPWFEPTYLNIENIQDFSMEDVTLCLKLKKKKIDILVHPDVIVGHIKQVELRV